jgi:hypothetical protein
MKNVKLMLVLLGTVCAVVWCAPNARSQEKPAPSTAEVHMVITDAAMREDAEFPPLQQQDVKVKVGKTVLDPTALLPAKGDRAALQFMILIDDVLDSNIGNDLKELSEFIRNLPDGTQVGVGYMSNTAISIAQNFTTDRELAAKAVRLPRGSTSSMDSPYLSLISLVKGWPQQKVRREVIIISDGIDRLRGERPEAVVQGPGGMPNFGVVYHSMPTISNDATSASEISQRYNVIVFPIYSVGIGRAARSDWDRQMGLSGLTKVADETGGECFSLSTSQPVSIKPYLDRISNYLDNQYYLVFQAPQGKKDRLQSVSVRTATKNSEILAAENVWVPGPPKAEKDDKDDKK